MWQRGQDVPKDGATKHSAAVRAELQGHVRYHVSHWEVITSGDGCGLFAEILAQDRNLLPSFVGYNFSPLIFAGCESAPAFVSAIHRNKTGPNMPTMFSYHELSS